MTTSTLGKYQLGRTLGSGVSCKVKIAKTADGKKFAVKILHDDPVYKELIEAEVDTLQKLHHPHIVNFVERGSGPLKTLKASSKVDYIVLELAQGGELFDFVANSGRFQEKVARAYFGQLIDALRYMHDSGICHRDLKPENIMFDKDFNLKVADFGFAAPTQGRDNSGTLRTQLGTRSYMAPEIHLGKPYTGASVDLFAAAIILFIMYTQRPPFNQANPNDPHYKLLAGGRADLFWKAHADADKDPRIFTTDFKDLFEKMVAMNPKHRLSVVDVQKHAWMQLPRASDSELRQEFAQRKTRVDEVIKNEQELKRTERAQQAAAASGARKVRRGEGASEEPEEEQRFADIDLPMKSFDADDYTGKQTQFFSTSRPVEIMRDLLAFLEQSEAKDLKFSDDTYKVSCAARPDLEVKCRVLAVDAQTVCVDFSRKRGDQLAFFEWYAEVVRHLTLHNDVPCKFE